jgi:hypothetical protein
MAKRASRTVATEVKMMCKNVGETLDAIRVLIPELVVEWFKHTFRCVILVVLRRFR